MAASMPSRQGNENAKSEQVSASMIGAFKKLVEEYWRRPVKISRFQGGKRGNDSRAI
jgi:hypothetical protein